MRPAKGLSLFVLLLLLLKDALRGRRRRRKSKVGPAVASGQTEHGRRWSGGNERQGSEGGRIQYQIRVSESQASIGLRRGGHNRKTLLRGTAVTASGLMARRIERRGKRTRDALVLVFLEEGGPATRSQPRSHQKSLAADVDAQGARDHPKNENESMLPVIIHYPDETSAFEGSSSIPLF